MARGARRYDPDARSLGRQIFDYVAARTDAQVLRRDYGAMVLLAGLAIWACGCWRDTLSTAERSTPTPTSTSARFWIY
jgi:hypothetical protein